MNRKSPDLITNNTFITYLLASLRRTTLYSMIGRMARYARRFLFLTRLFRYLSIALAILETSAILILLAGVLLALIPILLIVLIVFMIADRIIGTRFLKSEEMRRALEREQICVISSADTFGEGFAREMAEQGMTVFVVTADIHRRFLTMRQEDGITYIRHAFFFRLKHRIFASIPERMIYLL